jgi:hypothetical protein
MTKQEQFLWIVQTVFLADVANIHQMGISQVYRADISGTGTFITMDDAIWASGRIPKEMPARQAANEFCTYSIRRQRELQEKALGKPLDCPHWYKRA